MFTRKSLLKTVGLFALLAAPSSDQAQAAPALKSDRGDTFEHSAKVSDDELAKMRGGFIDVNGMLIDFGFLSRVQVGLNTISDISISTADLAQAALTAQQIQALVDPVVIQNMDHNTLISIQQALDLNIVGGVDAVNALAQLPQHLEQQIIGIY